MRNAATLRPDPDPGRDRRIEQRERQDRQDERRRVVEETEATGLLDGRVVEAFAGKDPAGCLMVGEEVVAERSRTDPGQQTVGRRRRRGPREPRSEGQRGPAAAPTPLRFSRRSVPRSVPTSGAALAEPAMDQRDPEQVPGDAERPGPDWRASAIRAGRPSGSARSPCCSRACRRRKINSTSKTMLWIRWRANRSLGSFPGEALEPALRVLDRADHPDRRELVERLAEHPPVPRLALAHVGAVRLDPAAERDVGRRERIDEQRELVRRGRHVGVGEDDEVGRRVRASRPGPRPPCRRERRQ